MFLKVRYRRWGCPLLLLTPPLFITRFELLLQLLVHLLPAQGLQALEKGLRASRYLPRLRIVPPKDTEFIAGFRDRDTLHFTGHNAVYQSNMKNNSYMDITREKKSE